MQRKDGLIPVAEALADLPGPVQAIRKTPPPARRGFTRADQVNQLVSASEADPDLGFMARLMALCSLPRTNPGHQHQYKRVNGPYTLVMNAGGLHKLPFGNLPRLLLAWVALLHNSGRVTDRSQSCLNAIEFALTQACPGLTYDSAPHI